MTNLRLLSSTAFCLVAFASYCPAQGKWNWQPESTTARSITGEVEFLSDKISINLTEFPAARIRDLSSVETNALFEAEGGAGGTGSLFRLSVPAAKKFLHHNTLCGSEDTQWIAAYMTSRSLHLAMFSGPAMPQFTPDALANSGDLCGTFSYVR